ncbi:hypothetical protein Nepgr_019043 [Nepenthes gracilis]|uniref:Calycin-like protein n=1 Tax=Nepenthes gracilis TaxID=150966 RepID=A0AAD3XTP1_NEPGR|nr:hypothetical protein Nepgr_019043 [Nepenthes gracilis]
MQAPCLDACKNFATTSQQFLGFHTQNLILDRQQLSAKHNCFVFFANCCFSPCISCRINRRNLSSRYNSKKRENRGSGGGGVDERGQVKGKDNVWSIDNELAKKVDERESDMRRRRRDRRRRVRKIKGSRVLVSGAMLMEVETVLQTQEPVIRPAWNTFVSSVSGIWKGVGAVFSPITAEMEPIEIGRKNENLYDCYTFSRVEAVPAQSGERMPEIRRKINWVTLNPCGEMQQQIGGGDRSKEAGKYGYTSSDMKEMTDGSMTNHLFPKFESFDLMTSDVMEDDVMGMEPGLVFFEDGSYSRGPVSISVGEVDESKYFLSPIYKFEQCLVKGCHKRLRIMHTIELSNGGADIQILRVAIYEEQWVSPANIHDHSEEAFDLKPFSQRRRTHPRELTGPWKVFEVSATPIYGDEIEAKGSNGSPHVYLCLETLKKRSLPENPAYFGEEEMLDMQDVTVLWLPGGVTAYVDINDDGILCIGVGWYSDEGINLVMERDYETDGKLKEARWKSEVKRRWLDPYPV